MFKKNLNRDIDFLAAYQDKTSKIEANKKALKPFILPLVLVIVFASGFGYFKIREHSLNSDINKLNNELTELLTTNAKNDDSDKIQALNELQTELTSIQSASDNVSSYPQISKTIIESIRTSCGNATLDALSFARDSGTIELSINANSAEGCQQVAKKLRESGIFDKVNYSGYTKTGGEAITTDTVDPTTGVVSSSTSGTTPISYTTSISCILKGGY